MNQLPARDGSLRRKAYELIQKKIISGEFVPGLPVSEIPLAREIGGSRTPVREAITRLVAEGLLEQIPGRGVVVAKPDRDDIIELYELREALEIYAVGKAARKKPQPEDLAKLRAYCDQIRGLADELRSSGLQHLDEAQMRRFLAADMNFHMLLLRMAGNRRIMKVVGETRVITRIFSYRREGHDAQLLNRIFEYHRDVVDAVESGNAPQAMERLGEHIRVSMQERLDTYDRWERSHELGRIVPGPETVLHPADGTNAGANPDPVSRT